MSDYPGIVFLGTPDFAVESLKILHQNNYNIKAVVTAPDKPAGRGKKIRVSAVKQFAIDNQLNILQPTNLKDSIFIDNLKSLNAELFIVVAFRMLPKIVWEMPKLGCFNLHASLLPDYRGAAPINHAVINGEKITGVTTFFINQNIDTGDIILQEKVEIKDNYNAGILHDILMETGAKLVLKTVENIINNIIVLKKQGDYSGKDAPKISKEFCKINWNDKASNVRNFIRGLSPYPGAYTVIQDENNQLRMLKIFDADILDNSQKNNIPASYQTDNNTFLKIACNDNFITVKDLQLESKKRMKIEEFFRGNSFNKINII